MGVRGVEGVRTLTTIEAAPDSPGPACRAAPDAKRAAPALPGSVSHGAVPVEETPLRQVSPDQASVGGTPADTVIPESAELPTGGLNELMMSPGAGLSGAGSTGIALSEAESPDAEWSSAEWPGAELPVVGLPGVGLPDVVSLDAELVGAGLAAALEAVDVDALSQGGLVDLLVRWRRLASWARAGELATVNLLADRYASDERLGGSWREWLGSEIALGLTLTEWSASALVEMAATLRDRLPGTLRFLEVGALDEPRVRVIVEGVKGLSETACHRVEKAILDQAQSLTTGQLRVLVATAVNRVAADEAVARCRASERSRRVGLRNDGQGTAEIYGVALPASPATAAFNRVDAIARAAKRAGDSRTTDQLRSDVF